MHTVHSDSCFVLKNSHFLLKTSIFLVNTIFCFWFNFMLLIWDWFRLADKWKTFSIFCSKSALRHVENFSLKRWGGKKLLQKSHRVEKISAKFNAIKNKCQYFHSSVCLDRTKFRKTWNSSILNGPEMIHF